MLRIGEREPETTRIEEAMAAYRDALGVLDPDTSLDWAMVQNNYGTALAILGHREVGTERATTSLECLRNRTAGATA